jgi:ABC-type Zn uptake system ZnuABC Zn-binding protein ZnuA
MCNARKIAAGLGLMILGGLTLGSGGCRKGDDPWAGQGGPPRVLVSFPPLYSFTKSVAGNDAAVLCLMVSQGPHEHSPDESDALKFNKANLFIMNGLHLEKKDLVDGLIKSTGNKEIRLVDLGESIEKEHAKDRVLLKHEEEEKGKDEHGHEHEEGEFDPHIWLDLGGPGKGAKPAVILMVEKIRDELIKADPAHKSSYQQRAADYIQKLEGLRKYGVDAFKGKKNRKIITQHDSLRYFARSFDLELVDSIQPKPGVEADPTQLAKLVEECKEKGVRVIAVEPQYSSSSAETLKRELQSKEIKDVQIVVIDPLETAVGDLDADFYVRKMRENIQNLSKALKK